MVGKLNNCWLVVASVAEVSRRTFDRLKSFGMVTIPPIAAESWKGLIDKSVPWFKARWGFSAFMFLLYVLRVYLIGGWYIVTYALGIYVLHLLIGFLSPHVDPELESEEETPLPTKTDDEYRPFIRRVPEFKFW